MKLRFTHLLVLALVLVLPCLVSAKTLTHEAGKFSVDIPETWKDKVDGDVLLVTAPDDSISIVMSLIDPKELDKACDVIETAVAKEIGDVTWDNEGKAKEETFNGLNYTMWTGTAKEGKIIVSCDAIDTPAEKTLLCYWFEAKETQAKWQADVDKIVNGIKPLGAVAPAAAPAAEPAAAPAADDTEKD